MTTTTTALLTVTAAALLTISTAACSKKDAVGSATNTAASPEAKNKGLSAAENDPAFVAATKSALQACGPKWDAKKGFEDCGDPLRAYRDKKFEGIDATLLNTLQDEDIKVRWFGAYALSSWGGTYRSDKALASRLFTIMENEKPGSILDAQLAYAAGSTYESAGLADRLEAYGLKATTAPDVKEVLAVWWSGEGGYHITKSLAGATDKKSVKTVVQGYASHFTKHEAEACSYWAAHLEDNDKDVRTSAVGHLTGGWSGNTTHDAEGEWYITGGGGGPSSSSDAWCSAAQVDDALAKIQRRIATNSLDDSNYIYGLSNLAKHKKATDAQHKLAVASLKKIIETKGCGNRSFALRRLVDAKPDEKAYAAKFLRDDDLKSTAADLLKPATK